MRKTTRNKALLADWIIIGEVEERDIFKGAFTKSPSLIQKKSSYKKLAAMYKLSEPRVRAILMHEMRKLRESRGILPSLMHQRGPEFKLRLV